ncbi:hypothetical protein [Ammoniphilus sp. YIM 78166]|uniref:hypothetical protein n=1 Tax=Ammoniphilus sp. YIM 78166 TaxID=1644106 RepID=UPI001431FAB5|nr:hypothetical protein [Ammoniphilus sp. YIM 78166]
MEKLKLDDERYSLIDSLLDSYNENIKLHQQYGKLCYKERAENFLEILKEHFKSK